MATQNPAMNATTPNEQEAHARQVDSYAQFQEGQGSYVPHQEGQVDAYAQYQQGLTYCQFENPVLKKSVNDHGCDYAHTHAHAHGGGNQGHDDDAIDDTKVEYIRYPDAKKSATTKVLLALVGLLVLAGLALVPIALGARKSNELVAKQQAAEEARAALEALQTSMGSAAELQEAREAAAAATRAANDALAAADKAEKEKQQALRGASTVRNTFNGLNDSARRYWGYEQTQTQQYGSYKHVTRYNVFTSIPFETKAELAAHTDADGNPRDGCCEENGACGAPDACCRFCWYNGACCCSTCDQYTLWCNGALTQQVAEFTGKGVCHAQCCTGCPHTWWIALMPMLVVFGTMGTITGCN